MSSHTNPPSMGRVERVAKAMYEAPIDGEPDVWPPEHPDDRAFWISRAVAAFDETLKIFLEALDVSQEAE